MSHLFVWIRSVVAFLMIIGACSAQHMQGEAAFDSGAKGTFECINFDVGNSGSGTMFTANGMPVNLPIAWTRDGDNVYITYQGVLQATLHQAGQNSTGGDATINDGSNTGGSWRRT